MSNKLVSIIIPSLPGYAELNNQLVDSLHETTDEQLDIVLCSQDQSFAKNVNDGLNRYKGDVVLVLNNDTTPLPGWYEWLVENADKGIVAMTPRGDCGWAFGMSRKIQEQVGLLDTNLVLSYEDYDFFIRAAICGYNRILPPTIYMIHEGGHTLNTVWGKFEEQRPERLQQCHANRDYMLNKYPGLDVDAVPSTYWALYGTRIVGELLGKTTR